MGPHSLGPFNLLIGESYATIIWVRFQIIFTETKVERIRYARAYIIEMIGGSLMPDLSRNLVRLMWLLKLIHFRAAGKFSWGSAVFATLYREM
ncbi:hypothetical protein Goshw_024309 [Gossypium schwendimanii]|uniref:Aminotransferase-like plant mobile domain-containing protein n=2 Tax=Gossypium schwendimanii TaxID=34291 RepID=A0A7J9L595_GOSSC|nr:hypothetical protein [Gossypium schwendimanii]